MSTINNEDSDKQNEDYIAINRQGWKKLVQYGCEWTQPYSSQSFAQARQLLDPKSWLPYNEIKSVLCLASGGGQQAPLFASLGYDVTVLDLSPEQLKKDREVAELYKFDIEILEGDMLDLSPLYGRNFDLVYQPVSAVYVPNVRRIYQEVFQVLKPKGYYFVTHWNPIYTQIPETEEWDGNAYRIVHPQLTGVPIPQTLWKVNQTDVNIITWQYIHSLDDLIGGLCDAGFLILRFAERSQGDLSAEPGSFAHLAAYLPAAFTLFSQSQSISELS